MNIQLYKEPGLVNFVDSKILAVLQSPNPYTTNGIKATATLSIANLNIDGQSFSLSWNNTVRQFTFKDVPDANVSADLYSDLYISQLNNGLAGDAQMIATYALERMRSDYYLSKDFEMAIDANNYIILTAKNYGVEYNITFDADTSNVSAITTSGQNVVLKTNYKLLIASYLHDAADSLVAILGEDRLPVDASGMAEFNLSGLLKNRVETQFVFPPIAVVSKKTPDYILRFDYGEFYNNDVPIVNKSGAYKLLPGGLSEEILQKIEAAGSIEEYFHFRKDFLTHSPAFKKISILQPEYLTYLVVKNSGSVKVCFSIDTSAGTHSMTETVQVSQFDKVEIAIVGKYFEDIYSEQILRINVWVEDLQGLRLTRTRLYVISYKKHRTEHHFLFKNSFGCVDTIRFSDMYVKDTEIEREEYLINSDNNGISKVGQDISFYFPMQFSIQSAADHSTIPSHFSEFFNEFLLSKLIKYVSGNSLKDAVINTKSATIRSTSVGDYRFEVEARLSQIDPHQKVDVDHIENVNFDNTFSNYFNK